MAKQCALTTIDNPFNPFENFSSWFEFDIEKGYYSSSKLMRVANVTDEMSSVEEDEEIERAIDKIIKNDFTNTYKKVSQTLIDPT